MKKVLGIIVLVAVVFVVTGCMKKDLDVTKLKSDKFEHLSYQVPEQFEKEMNDYESNYEDSTLHFSDYHYNYEKKGSNGKFDDMCSLSFFYDDDSHRDYSLEEYSNIFNEGKVGEKKTINGVEWYVVKDGDEKMLDYSYYARYNNVYYEVYYSDWGSGPLCEKALEVIENSLKFE